MAYYTSVEAVVAAGEQYSNNCVDGKCSGCGECCADLLPVTPEEIRKIRAYVEKHHIKEHKNAPFFDPNAVDLTCPLRNNKERRCEVYPVRPKICREFICSKSLQQAKHDRDLIHASRAPHSMRWEIFSNPEVIRFFASLSMKGKVGT